MKMRIVYSISVFACLIFFIFTSCGLDTTYYVESPSFTGHTVSYTSSDRTEHYFTFRTQENYSNSSFTFLGTEVYYRIYDNASTMLSTENSIDALSDTAQGAAVVNSYGYRTLKLASGGTPSPLIAATGSNRYVYVRLSNYNTSDYQACVCVGFSDMTKYEASCCIGCPKRFLGSNYGFDFGKDSSNPVPVSGDSDASVSSSSSTYYIDVYAVAVGLDTVTNTTSYSSALRLGSVTVRTSDF